MELGPISKRVVRELEAPAQLRALGTGWLAGAGALLAALAAFLLTLTLRYPALLSTPELQAIATGGWFRLAVQVLLAVAYVLALINFALRENKTLGFVSIGLVLTATILGALPVSGLAPQTSVAYFGLDFFVLNLIFAGVLFVPIEKLFSHREGQELFRTDWREDLFYYLVSSLFVQVLTYLTLAPSNAILANTQWEALRTAIGNQPYVLQLFELMVLSDFMQYWVHRTFHAVPALWRFHAVHHSAQTMDWLASARMHILEVICLRAISATPMLILGFDQAMIQVYLLIVYLTSSFVHSNLALEWPALERWFVLPRFHHWHHGEEREAVDVNFAIHFPILDRMFGTYYLPDGQWPKSYGIEGHPVPKGYWQQFLYPFRRD